MCQMKLFFLDWIIDSILVDINEKKKLLHYNTFLGGLFCHVYITYDKGQRDVNIDPCKGERFRGLGKGIPKGPKMTFSIKDWSLHVQNKIWWVKFYPNSMLYSLSNKNKF